MYGGKINNKPMLHRRETKLLQADFHELLNSFLIFLFVKNISFLFIFFLILMPFPLSPYQVCFHYACIDGGTNSHFRYASVAVTDIKGIAIHNNHKC